MELRKICEDTSDMGMWELAHNFVFIKNREAWYRDFDQEISVLDLMREIIKKHGGTLELDSVKDQGTSVKITLPLDTKKGSTSD